MIKDNKGLRFSVGFAFAFVVSSGLAVRGTSFGNKTTGLFSNFSSIILDESKRISITELLLAVSIPINAAFFNSLSAIEKKIKVRKCIKIFWKMKNRENLNETEKKDERNHEMRFTPTFEVMYEKKIQT